MQYMTTAQIKCLLGRYYDLPEMIQQEQQLLAELEREHVDAGDDPQLVREIHHCRRRIVQRREEWNWCNAALATLDRAQRCLLELAYMGPKDPQRRKTWTRTPSWKEIVQAVDYSKSRAQGKAKEALEKLSALSGQEATGQNCGA